MHLQHEGIKGMHWGVRRYQNKDGSLTPEGRRHYSNLKQAYKDAQREGSYAAYNYKRSSKEANNYLKRAVRKAGSLDNLSDAQLKKLRKKQAMAEYFKEDYEKKYQKARELTDAAKDRYGRLSVRDLKTRSANINGQKVDLITNSVVRGRDVANYLASQFVVDNDDRLVENINHRPTNRNYKRNRYLDEVIDFNRYYQKYGS